MAFNVQNDEGTTVDANAYVSEAYLVAYWADRGYTFTQTSPELEALIVEATGYEDIRFVYKETPLNGRDQTTEFPRLYLYDNHEYLVEGIPREVKDACCEYVKASLDVPLTYNSDTSSLGTITKNKSVVGPIEKEVQYAGGQSKGSGTFAVFQTADNLLKRSGFVKGLGGLPVRG